MAIMRDRETKAVRDNIEATKNKLNKLNKGLGLCEARSVQLKKKISREKENLKKYENELYVAVTGEISADERKERKERYARVLTPLTAFLE